MAVEVYQKLEDYRYPTLRTESIFVLHRRVFLCICSLVTYYIFFLISSLMALHIKRQNWAQAVKLSEECPVSIARVGPTVLCIGT